MADCDVAGEGNHFVHPKYQLRNAVRWLIGAILLIGIASIAFLVYRSGKLSGRIVYVKNVYGGYGGVYSSKASWSPNGRFAAFSGSLNPSGGHLGIYIVDLKTKEVWRITDFYDGDYSDPDWSFGD